MIGWNTLAGALLTAAALAGGAQAATPAAATCPSDLPAGARCYRGVDGHGAFYWIAVPQAWNGALVVHSHGGPSLNKPTEDTPVSDLKRFAVMVQEGFAWAGSAYRHAGFGVQDAAADTDEVRKVFWQAFGKPRYTFVHGQSWGGNVAVRVAEHYARDAQGAAVYDGALFTNGIVAGGDLAYDFRADLRALYQYYCRNLPRPDEPQYPLWEGLGVDRPPAGVGLDKPLPPAVVTERINACLGLDRPAAARTEQQGRALRNLARVARVAESAVGYHVAWATGSLRDLTMRQLGGLNPFSNVGVVYAGSDDDVALNREVPRFAATAAGRAALKEDSGVSGQLTIPAVSLHAIGDPTVFVETEHAYRDKVERAGQGAHLLQVYTRENEHSRLAAPEYAAALRVLTEWVRTGKRPAAEEVVAQCEAARQKYGEACYFDLKYEPAALESRVYARTWPQP